MSDETLGVYVFIEALNFVLILIVGLFMHGENRILTCNKILHRLNNHVRTQAPKITMFP